MKNIFKTNWFSIDSIKYKKKKFYKINHNNAVVILGLTKDNKVILIKQYRPIQKKLTLEFPSGNIDKKEKPIKAAKRELFEETGYSTNKIYMLGKGILRLERESSMNYFFIAFDCKFKKKTFEDIQTILISKKRLKNLILKNKINQIAAYPMLVWAFRKYNIKIL